MSKRGVSDMIDRFKELEFLPAELFRSENLSTIFKRGLYEGTFVPIGTINSKECLGDRSDRYMHGCTVLFRSDVEGKFEDKLYIEPDCDVLYANADNSEVLFENKKKLREQDLLREESKQYGKIIFVKPCFKQQTKNNPIKEARERYQTHTFDRVDILRDIIQTEITNPNVSLDALKILKTVYHNCYYMLGHEVTDYAKAHLDEVRAMIVAESICADSTDMGLAEYSRTCMAKYNSLYNLVNSQSKNREYASSSKKQALIDEFLL